MYVITTKKPLAALIFLSLLAAGCASQDRRGEGGPGGLPPRMTATSGPLVAIDGDLLSIAGIRGKTSVRLGKKTEYYAEKAATSSDVSVGSWAVVTLDASSSASSLASSILIYSARPASGAAQEGPGPGRGPGAEKGSAKDEGPGTPPGPGPDMARGGPDARSGGRADSSGGSLPPSFEIVGKVLETKAGAIVLSVDRPGSDATMTVTTSKATEYSRMTEISKSKLKAGVSVTARGSLAEDGSMDAVEIDLRG